MLTKVPGVVLSDYYSHGYPFTPKMADRPYNQYGPYLYSEDRWDQLCTWLTENSNFRLQLAGHKQALRDHMGYSQEASDPGNKARRTVPPPGAGSSSSAAGPSWHSMPPPSPSPYGWSCGWWQKGSQQWGSSHTATISSSLDLLQEVGGLGHPLSCGLIVITVLAMATYPLSQLFGSSKSNKHARITAYATTPPHQDRYEVSLELVTIAGTEYAMQADLSHCEDVAELEDFAFCRQSLV